MLAAEAAYCALEDDLQHYLDTFESTHDYDEYHFDLEEIEHDPYVLLSLLCALHEGQWTINEVQGTLHYDKYARKMKKYLKWELIILDHFLLHTITDEREIKILFEFV